MAAWARIAAVKNEEMHPCKAHRPGLALFSSFSIRHSPFLRPEQ
jgi:hypothetical protein